MVITEYRINLIVWSSSAMTSLSKNQPFILSQKSWSVCFRVQRSNKLTSFLGTRCRSKRKSISPMSGESVGDGKTKDVTENGIEPQVDGLTFCQESSHSSERKKQMGMNARSSIRPRPDKTVAAPEQIFWIQYLTF